MSTDQHIRTAGIALSGVIIPSMVGLIQPILGVLVTILAGLWYIMELAKNPTVQRWFRLRHIRKLRRIRDRMNDLRRQ